jgi:hypothetical protein
MIEQQRDSRASIPTKHQLEAQRLVLSVVGAGAPIDTVRNSYSQLPTNGIHGFRELSSAEEDLILLALLEVVDGRLQPTAVGIAGGQLSSEDYGRFVVARLLQMQHPLWLSVAVGSGHVLRELIPDNELALLKSYFDTSDELDVMLLSGGSKVDTELRDRIGLDGELAVVAACKERVAVCIGPEACSRVVHVSLFSDGLGFDVSSPSVDGGRVNLEVKTTTGTSDYLNVYLSRHEADVAAMDPRWRLVVCSHDGNAASVVGWCTYACFAGFLPSDTNDRARWESARITLHRADLTEGLPIDVSAGSPR